MTLNIEAKERRNLYMLVLVAALGYFVDIYDIITFSIIRLPSLSAMGVNLLDKDLLFRVSAKILNYQMAGFLLGGIVWGILGDKRGRIGVLFFTISLYSLCMIATSFVTNVDVYAWVRLITGFALAGEFGIGITIVLESLSIQKRGLAGGLVAMIGILGAFLAYILGKIGISWEWLYRIGGILGFVLLIFRISTHESHTYLTIKKQTHIIKGNFLLILKNGKQLIRYISIFCLSWGSWFVVGVLVSLIDNFITYPGAKKVEIGLAVMITYLGLSTGDVLIAYLSKWIKSRKKSVAIYFFLQIIGYIMYFTPAINHSVPITYFICFFLGFSGGYWAMFHIIAAEQFGTNMRSTVTTTISNFARGSLLITLWFIKTTGVYLTKYVAAELWAVITVVLSFVALYFIKETYGIDLNFVEE